MIKDTIISNQPIFYQILKNCFESHKIPHAFLLVGKNTYNYAHFIAKSLICEDDLLACESCDECSRIDRHSYGDLIFVDGSDETIKKGNIEYIQTQFSKSSLEGKAKIYMLHHIENATVEAMNSLLKVLEEPTDDIYAIFTCQNLNRVLPTIQSRCQVIQLLPGSKLNLRNKLTEMNLSHDDIHVLSELFNDFEECKEYIESEFFEYIKNEVYHFIEDLYMHRDNLIINVQTHLLKDYKDKENIRLFLNMLVLSLKDLFHVKHGIELNYPSFKGLYDKIVDSDESIMDKIELVLSTEYLLESNANVMLLIESMMYRM